MTAIELTQDRLREDLDEAGTKTARAYIGLRGAPKGVRRVVQHAIWIGPCALVYGCGEDELHELFRALEDLAEGAIPAKPEVPDVVRIVAELQPREVRVRLSSIQSGTLDELRSLAVLDEEDPDLTVRPRDANPIAWKRDLAWLLDQSGLPSAQSEGEAA